MSESSEKDFGLKLQDQQLVDHFNQADAGWVQASETAKVLSMNPESNIEALKITFERLSENNIDTAKEFADKVFALEKGLAGKDLESQIRPTDKESEHSGEIDKNYWVAKSDSGEIVGITGFSSFEVDKPEHCWLGWFALKPGMRGAKIGEQLLEKAIIEAKNIGKTDMYIISSDHPDMAGNAKFYNKNQFPIVAVMDKRATHMGESAKDLPPAILEKMYEDYGTFVDEGVNIFVRRKTVV